ncbi:MAG: glycosyltransferase family 4 protein [Candidatus Ratteibacteria bacterium]
MPMTDNQKQPYKISFVISSLGCGGAERIVTRIANSFSSLGNSVNIITFDSPSKKPFFALTDSINLVQCDLLDEAENFMTSLKNNIKRILVIRRVITKMRPDIVISFMDRTNVITLIATRFLKIPVIVSERTDPILCFPGEIWHLLRLVTYPFACKIVVQTEKIREKYPLFFQKKISVIPNPVMKPENRAGQRQGNLIVGVGRLSEEKNFQLLIRAFANIRKKYPQWHLEIYGEGPLRKQLENLVIQLDLKESVKLPGVLKDIDQLLQKADIFVLCSKFEGFPNVLCEAMASGCAVIATKCDATGEIIVDNYNGLLVEHDLGYLEKAIERLIDEPNLRKKLGENAKKIVEKYSMDDIVWKWLKLIERCKSKWNN